MNHSYLSESPAEFSQRASTLLNSAIRASAKHDGGDLTALNPMHEPSEGEANDLG
jgi:hypothetical protein